MCGLWSCTKENISTMHMDDHVDIDGPLVKAESDYDYEEPEQLSMATVLSENVLANHQRLTLILVELLIKIMTALR